MDPTLLNKARLAKVREAAQMGADDCLNCEYALKGIVRYGRCHSCDLDIAFQEVVAVMEEIRQFIRIDLSIASPIVIKVLIEDAVDSQALREILLSNLHRKEIIRLLYDSPYVTPEIREDARKVLGLTAKRGGSSR